MIWQSAQARRQPPRPTLRVGARESLKKAEDGRWILNRLFVYGSKPNKKHPTNVPNDFRCVREYLKDGCITGPLRPSNINDEQVTEKPNLTDQIFVEEMKLQVDQNSKKHYTNKFEQAKHLQEQLIVRRGFPFDIKIKFNRCYKGEHIDIIFECGTDPKETKGSSVKLNLQKIGPSSGWFATIKEIDDQSVIVTVTPSPNCPVANWDFGVDTIDKSGSFRFRYHHPYCAYILFNPWCEMDKVFMDESNLLKEYILNDHGQIYTCGDDFKKWCFGQFKEETLNIVFRVIEQSKINLTDCTDPVKLVRTLSHALNTYVLQGAWPSPCDQFSGSSQILTDYYNKNEKVKYGQCFVFSGIYTTLLRALGIPTRSVTNVQSGHDRDESVTIDYFKNNRSRNDSVWNFHVWNECWIQRPDLKHAGNFGGWQVVDATPLGGDDILGPFPVCAVKLGRTDLSFDGAFIFAEVNADKIDWHKRNGKYYVTDQNTYKIGQQILTKAPFSTNSEDLTKKYKFEEETKEERASVYKAVHISNRKHPKPWIEEAYKQGPDDVEIVYVESENPVHLGETISINLKIRNNGNENRRVDGTFLIRTLYAHGMVGDRIYSEGFSRKLIEPSKEIDLNLTVAEEKYKDKVHDCLLDLNFCFFVQETRRPIIFKKAVSFIKPELNVVVERHMNLGNSYPVQISFKNPLDLELTKAKVLLDGLVTEVLDNTNVPRKGNVLNTFNITPERLGSYCLHVEFMCEQINHIKAKNVDILVEKKPVAA